MKNINDLTLDEIREELGTSVYNEELASFIGTRLKINVSNIQVLDLINYLINNQDILIDYANKYLLYSQAKKEFKEYLLNKYKVILNMGD